MFNGDGMPDPYEADLWHNNQYVGRFRATGNDESDAETVKRLIAEKGLANSSTDLQKISAQARRFYEASEVLYASGHANLTVPYIVNGCFCVELYLKAFHALLGPYPTGHELTILYESLAPEIRGKILSAYEASRPFDVSSDLQEALVSLNRSFVEWRYLNERAGTGVVSSKALRHLINALRATLADC